jgi:hypothetical protein
MFLLQLPIWSYVVFAIAVSLIAGSLPRFAAERREARRLLRDRRRARAAVGLLRMLGDQQLQRAIGVEHR